MEISATEEEFKGLGSRRGAFLVSTESGKIIRTWNPVQRPAYLSNGLSVPGGKPFLLEVRFVIEVP